MAHPFWFNRMVEYWSMPLNLDLIDLVRRARIQLVQAGTFGPQFYSLADDPEADRRWVGMPLVGVRENLAHAERMINGVQEAGARFIGQMSMSWHYGDHETNKGLFGVWDTLWTDDLLGPAPCADPSIAQERMPDGSLRCRPIEGRPYRAYSGCLSNPHWAAILKPMIRKAIELGVDGLMVHHNFTAFCGCSYCQADVRARFRQAFDETDLSALFGTSDLEEIEDLFNPRSGCPESVKQRAADAIGRWEHERRKRVFDELYLTFGRSLKPDLMLAQWYHKYNFKPRDERSFLPSGLWAKDEDYIWYSQGGHKGMSLIRHGYLTDMGLPARFIYAAGGGRPFVINKYDYRRFRLSIAEAGANHGAAPAFHWAPQEEAAYNLGEYTGPLIRYHQFLADHDDLIRGAKPASQAALVYPRRAELAGEGDALDALKRLGRILEDHHLLFEIILDEQLTDRCGDFELLMLPNIKRLTMEETACIRRFVAKGGKLVMTGDTGALQPDGQPHETSPFSSWQIAPLEHTWGRITTERDGRILHIPTAPWKPEDIDVTPDLTLPLYPLPDQDPFGQAFMKDLNTLLDPLMLDTDAPWFVRVRAWQTADKDAFVLHWVNYQQDEDTDIEVPIPTGTFLVDYAIPPGYNVDHIEWRYPEMREPVTLPHEVHGARVRFTIPGVIVYGLSVMYVAPKHIEDHP
jgi:hypothetical protein